MEAQFFEAQGILLQPGWLTECLAHIRSKGRNCLKAHFHHPADISPFSCGNGLGPATANLSTQALVNNVSTRKEIEDSLWRDDPFQCTVLLLTHNTGLSNLPAY